jgi:predicted flap endonuclease-1-like 5' DNA nuclease
MNHKVAEIEGVGTAHAGKLEKARIKTVNDLLKSCCDAEGRRRVSETAGISEIELLRWSHMADLMRVTGIGPEYSALLEAAGVLTIRELRHRIPAHLVETLKEVDILKNLTRSIPSEKEVTKWVEKAKTMGPNVCESADLVEKRQA